MRHNFFSKTPFSKLLMFMRQSEKIWKMLLATRWSLVGARVTKFVYIYLCDTTCFSKTPFSKLLMFMRQSEKIWKCFLQHAGHLLEQGSQHLFIYTYATQFFFKTPFSKLLMFMRQSEKIRKMLLATRWSLVGAKGVTNLFCILDGAKWQEIF